MCNSSHPGLETISQKIRRNFELRKYNRVYASKLAAAQDNLGLGQLFPVRAFFVLSYRLLQYPILFPWYVFSLSLKFRRSNFDRFLVVNGGYPASLLCRSAIVAWRFSGKSRFGIMNFPNSVPLARMRHRIFENYIDRLVAQSSSYMVSVTKNCLDSLSRRPAFNSYRQLIVINNGIEDAFDLNRNTTTKPVVKSIEEPFILMLSTYEPRKGHAFMLKAFQVIHQAYPNLKLRIYGYNVGNRKEEIQAEVQNLGLSSLVELNDFTSQTHELLLSAKILVAPSQEYESFNLTIIEAMASGLPVVTTDVGGMPEVLGDSGAGYISSKDNPAEFAANVVRILENDAIESAMRINGRKTYVNKYTASKMASKYRNLLL